MKMDKINNVAITTENLFAALNIFARFSNKKSVCKNELGLKNSLIEKKVVFIADKNDEKMPSTHLNKNRDSMKNTSRELRISDILLSFGELVVLSPVYLLISLTIVIDNPDLTSLRMRFT